MLTDFMEITTKAPDDNRQYWTPFVERYKKIIAPLINNKCLYPLNISFEKVLRQIKYEFPPVIAEGFAHRELELREEIGFKKAEHYHAGWFKPDFDDLPRIPNTLPCDLEEAGLMDVVRDLAGIHFPKFAAFDQTMTPDDVMAEVMFLLLKCYDKYDPRKASIKTYMNTVISNHILDLWRKRNRRAKRMEKFVAETQINMLGYEIPNQTRQEEW